MTTLKLKKIRQERFMKRCAIEFTADGKTHVGISMNFSLSGLFVRTRRQFPPGTIIDMSVYLPAGSISKLKGRVARVLTASDGRGACLDDGMGITIIEKDHDYLRFMSSLVAGHEANLTKPR